MIIKSLLDSDLYKFTMAGFAFNQFPNAIAEYQFVCRTKGVNLLPFKNRIEKEIEIINGLKFNKEEIDYLTSLNLFNTKFLNYLKSFKLKSNQISLVAKNNNLEIYAKGIWFESIFWEIIILAIVNEVYFESSNSNDQLDNARKILDSKIIKINKVGDSLKIIEFGTRRRFSQSWQKEMLFTLKNKISNNLIGTSNVYLAKELNLKPIGTLAHELLQAGQVLSPDLKRFQSFILNLWYKEYGKKLAITLTDVINTDKFLEDFDSKLSYEYEGVRHDSGDPLIWTEKILNHYKTIGINPQTKKLIFSDGLNIDKCIEILNFVDNRIPVSFGIGTNLSNDTGIPAINIVMKLIKLNDKPVAKISDEPNKKICVDNDFLKNLEETFK